MRKWSWIFDPDEAELPDISLFLSPDAVTVKQNPVRTVSRIQDAAGQVYYVKRDTPHGFFPSLKAFFRCKNLSEFKTAQWLRKEGIPCLRYIAAGRCFPESVLVSRELAGFLPSMQFWCSFPERRTVFLHALCTIVRNLNERKIRHPDFHAGNLMCREDEPENPILVDLYGIHRTRLAAPAVSNCHILTDFAAELLPEQGEMLVSECGADRALWDILLEKNRVRILAEWPRRQKQILSGNSKFSRTEIMDGQVVHIRNSRWFTPLPFHPDALTSKTCSAEEGLAIWLDSFRKDMLHEKTHTPLAIRRDARQAVLYFNENTESGTSQKQL